MTNAADNDPTSTKEDSSSKEQITEDDPNHYIDTSTSASGASQDRDGLNHKSKSKNHEERDPFFAFIPQVAGWAFGVACHEAKIAECAIVGFPSWSREYLGETYSFYRENPRILSSEIISGFTVAIMQVPESIAFPFVAGVPPLSGLQATFWLALITGICGGKPGMISGMSTFMLSGSSEWRLFFSP